MIWTSKVCEACVLTEITKLDCSNLCPDQEWLDAMNAERKKEQLDQVSYETFEIIMDRLEKEWFELVSYDNLPLEAVVCDLSPSYR